MFRWFERGGWVVLLFLAFALGYFTGVRRTINNLNFWSTLVRQECASKASLRVAEHVRAELYYARQLLACQVDSLKLKKGDYVSTLKRPANLGGVGGN